MTERLKKDIIKLVIDEVVIEGESVKIFATIPLPNKIHEREMDKTDIPGTFNAGATLCPVNETNMARIWNHSTKLMTSKHKQSNTPLKRKVFVGVSGGVDSSVALALLKKEGHDVTGVFLKTWYPEWLPCNWKEERRSAMRVCATLGVPFLTIDCEAEYKKEVVDYMIREYGIGRVPNPDIFCNKYVKFGVFLEKALEMGADFIATGHYVISAQRKSCMQEHFGKAKNVLLAEGTIYELWESNDKEKDQSYFLYTLGQKELKHVLFPVGGMTKHEVRKLAEKFKLPTATKKDSQGICFLGEVNMKDFLLHYIKTEKGNVLNTSGDVIGYHDGALLYTIGERHGFTMTKKSPDDPRFFVISKDLEENTITVADKESENDKINTIKEIIISDMHFISGVEPSMPLKTFVRIRYRQQKQSCTLILPTLGVGKYREYRVVFDNSQGAIASGQSAVLYDGEVCLGGGIIDKVV